MKTRIASAAATNRTGYWKRVRAVGGVAAAVTAAVVLSASPASASGDYSGLSTVAGSGGFSDDWNDEGILSTSRHASSNATCLWQKVLWADGKLDWNSIDGVFGSGTREATKAWQRRWVGAGAGADDGVVGKATFTAAGRSLADTDGNGSVDTYIGTDGRSFLVGRTADGDYTFYDRNGEKRLAGYNYRTCT
ncbi:peptidoglycan-binding domain-containing protein [Streptomyces sp. NPDC045431]|uniref:peptidoglycan-binding domain-containing protein n=1 Tax=Streptomyces sp. NPDC045431 TaxID=3155613 RepID=UPI0034085DE5